MKNDDNKEEKNYIEKLAEELGSAPFITVSAAFGTYCAFNEIDSIETIGDYLNLFLTIIFDGFGLMIIVGLFYIFATAILSGIGIENESLAKTLCCILSIIIIVIFGFSLL